jgi:hypothetical protein
MQIILTDKHYGEAHRRASFYDQMLERLAALPGVEGAALAPNVPYGDNESIAPYVSYVFNSHFLGQSRAIRDSG